MTVYVVVKAAHQIDGDFVFFTTERAFRTEDQATAHMTSVPRVWSESVQGVSCFCERAVHAVDLND